MPPYLPHVLSVHRRSEDASSLKRTSSEAREAADAVLSPVLSRAREQFREDAALSGESTLFSSLPAVYPRSGHQFEGPKSSASVFYFPQRN